MSAENRIDAALAGRDAGELVTIPGLHDADDWNRWEADRRRMSKKFGNATPAPRYTNAATRQASLISQNATAPSNNGAAAFFGECGMTSRTLADRSVQFD